MKSESIIYRELNMPTTVLCLSSLISKCYVPRFQISMYLTAAMNKVMFLLISTIILLISHHIVLLQIQYVGDPNFDGMFVICKPSGIMSQNSTSIAY